MQARSVRILVAALLAALILAQPAPAQTPLAPGGWVTFSWFNGVNPIDDPFDGFFLSLLEPAWLRVTDGFFSGDAFDVFLNGSLAFATPSVTGGIDTGASTGSAAWADARLSKGEVLLQPGDYQVDLAVREDAGFGYGEGFIQARLARVSTVPEPASLALLASGLVGLAGAARRRRRDRRTSR